MSEKPSRSRRSFRSLFLNRHSHLNLAILSSVFIFLPYCIATVIALYMMSSGVASHFETGSTNAEIMEFTGKFAAIGSLVLVTNFLLLTLGAAYLALKVTHQIVGPVQKPEDQLDAFLNGDFAAKSTLRKNDYLAPIGNRLNELSDQLGTKK